MSMPFTHTEQTNGRHSRSASAETRSEPAHAFTFPGYHTLRRHKPRRWPLVLRITKGSVHSQILLPVFFHTAYTCLIVYIDLYHRSIGLPGSVIPSLSIVVGLMLVFRNGTSYDRFWSGRNQLAGIVACARNLARTFLVCSRNLETDQASEQELLDTETVVRMLIAVLYSVKHHLRSEFAPSDGHMISGAPFNVTASGLATPLSASMHESSYIPTRTTSFTPLLRRSTSTISHTLHNSTLSHSPSHTNLPVYKTLLRHTPIPSLEARGVCLPFQLSLSIEAYIRRGLQRHWWIAPQAATLQAQLSTLLAEFARMDTIRSTPMPIAHLVHTRQVLALYLMALPFAVVDQMGWWSVVVVSLVCFTLYGIEGIGRQLEDPFGYDKNDIKMDAILLDAQQEIEALLDAWKSGGGTFD